MKCSKCSAEIRVGSVYCENCGEPAQIVPDYNILEDDFLVTILDEKKKEKETKRIQEEKTKNTDNKNKPVMSKKFKIWLGIGSVAVVALIVFLIVFGTSYGHYVNKGLALDKKEKYADAITYYEKAIKKDDTKVTAKVLAANDYLRIEEYDRAEELYMAALQCDNNNLEAYKGLLSLYLVLDDYDAIGQLQEGVTNKKVLKLFADNLVVPPVFSEEGGKFNDDVVLELTSEDGFEIYYTDDGSDPSKGNHGIRYREPITITEGKTNIKATCKNENGEWSQVIVQKYNISYKNPDKPQIDPAGGTFTTPTAINITVPEGSVVYFTWDGTTPTKESTSYAGPIEIPVGNNILSVMMVDKHGRYSDVAQYKFKYIPQ